MNVMKMAVTGVVGFAIGAGAMLMPGNQKLRRQVTKQMDQIKKMSKNW